MERTENLIMQEDRWKPLKEMNLTDDFLFDVATAELENCKTIIELSTGLRLKSLKWKEGQKVIHNIPGKRGTFMQQCMEVGRPPRAGDHMVADLNDVDEHGVQIDHFLYLSKHI